MATVPQKTLSWLWDVLQREYRDPRRVYADLAQALSLYAGFTPRTDVYTYENGVSALLLHVSGTVPIDFRGARYRFPVAIWIPHAYPYESPIIYVTPTDDIVIRPGQHVSPADGKVYHPYLANWREAWERSNIVDLLKALADIFSREPPLMAKHPALGPQMPPHIPQPGRASVPYQPLVMSARPPSVTHNPPPPPPKPGQQLTSNNPSGPAQSPTGSRYNAPLPLPGQHRQANTSSFPPQARYDTQWQNDPQNPYPYRQAGPPPGVRDQIVPNLVSPKFPQQHVATQQLPIYSPQQNLPHENPPGSTFKQPQPQPQAGLLRPQHLNPQYQAQVQRAKPREPNLMDESPFDVSLPTSSANLPTPVIPPNPEKQHILQSLQTTLLSNLHNQISQTTSAVTPLNAQYFALQEAQYTLQQELTQLQALQSQLQQNITSLNTTITSADRTIGNARNDSSPSKIPSIDELIVPPTVVARQLYDAVAEQRGYAAAIYVLTEGFVRGRVGYDIWIRKTRECAREEFKRKWLVQRIGTGMSLDLGHVAA